MANYSFQSGSLLGWRLRVVLSGFVVTAIFLGTMALAGTQSEAQRAEAWAAAGDGATLSTLEDLAAYPQAYRIEAFKKLDPDLKARLWRQQVQKFVDDTPGLSVRQRAFVERILGMAAADEVRSKADAVQCEDVKQEFPDMVVARALRAANIAAFAVPRKSLTSRWIHLKEQIISGLTAHADAACDCFNTGWCECIIHECCFNSNVLHVCSEAGTSCGCIWEDPHPCNGICMTCPYLE